MKKKIEAVGNIIVIAFAVVVGSVFLKDRLALLLQNRLSLRLAISWRMWPAGIGVPMTELWYWG